MKDAADLPPPTLKLLLLVIVLPMVVSLFATWEISRLIDFETRQARIAQALATVETAQQAHGPEAEITFRNGEKTPASTIKKRLLASLTRGEKLLWWESHLRKPLSAAALVLGLLGFSAGLYGLCSVRRTSHKALLSRQVLLEGFEKEVRRLPWVLGIFAACLAFSAACIISFEASGLVLYSPKSQSGGRGIGLAIISIGALIYFGVTLAIRLYQRSRAVFETQPLDVVGKSLSIEEAPVLWKWIEGIAGKAGTVKPDHVVIGFDSGFFVTEHPVQLAQDQQALSGRLLYLPLPYLLYLNKQEAEAVIAHELSHFAGEDTEYSLRFNPLYNAALSNLEAILDTKSGDWLGKPALLFGQYYIETFDHAVQHWNREREFAADRLGVQIAGNEAVASSLLKIHALAEHVESVLIYCWKAGGKIGGTILQKISERVREKGFEDLEAHLGKVQAHPTDTHPPTWQRLKAIGFTPDALFIEKTATLYETTLLEELGLHQADFQGSIAGMTEILFKTVMAEQQAEFESLLSHIAGRAEGEWTYMEATVLSRTLVFMLALIGLAGLVACWRKAKLPLIPLAAFGLMTMAFGFWGCALVRRARLAFMQISSEGFICRLSRTRFPWQAMTNYYVMVNSLFFFKSFNLTIELQDDFVFPADFKRGWLKLKTKKKVIVLHAIQLKKPQDLEHFIEHFHAFWQAALAREALADLGSNTDKQADLQQPLPPPQPVKVVTVTPDIGEKLPLQ